MNPANEVGIKIRPQSFATFSVGGVTVEVRAENIANGEAALKINAAKPIKELRVLQELPGMIAPPPAPAPKPAPKKSADPEGLGGPALPLRTTTDQTKRAS